MPSEIKWSQRDEYMLFFSDIWQLLQNNCHSGIRVILLAQVYAAVECDLVAF